MANKPVLRPCGWCGVPQTAREDRQHRKVCPMRGADAVAAERERCAQIAEYRSAQMGTSREFEAGQRAACAWIAERIRSGSLEQAYREMQQGQAQVMADQSKLAHLVRLEHEKQGGE